MRHKAFSVTSDIKPFFVPMVKILLQNVGTFRRKGMVIKCSRSLLMAMVLLPIK